MGSAPSKKPTNQTTKPSSELNPPNVTGNAAGVTANDDRHPDLCSSIKAERMFLRRCMTAHECVAIVDYMYSKNAIIMTEMEHIKGETNATFAASKILDHVERKGNHVAAVFIEALRLSDVGMSLIADKLEAKTRRQSDDQVGFAAAQNTVTALPGAVVEELPSELSSRVQQLASAQNTIEELRKAHKEKEEELNQKREEVKELQSELSSTKQQLEAAQNTIKTLLDSQKEQEHELNQEPEAVKKLRLELSSTMQQLAAAQNQIKKLSDAKKDLEEQLDLERGAVRELPSELSSRMQQLEAPTTLLNFGSEPRGMFTGLSTCWDVAVTPQGHLLVASQDDGLKEFDATSFHEVSSWKPDSNILGVQESTNVNTVDVLPDGRALVGLQNKLLVLLQRDASSNDSNISTEAWRVERRVAELQTPPRKLSVLGEYLLAALEDRLDGRTNSWCCGPSLVLLSLTEWGKELRRLKLGYNAGSVALTDHGVVVASDDEVELTDDVDGSKRKCFVVDCCSHLGFRLWRHEVGGGCKVMSVFSDSVRRVIYAAVSGAVVALSVDNGSELSKAIRLSTKETKNPYAIAFDRSTQRMLALLSSDGDHATIVAVFSV